MARPLGSGPRPLPTKYWFVSYALGDKDCVPGFGNTVLEIRGHFFPISGAAKEIKKKNQVETVIIISFQEISKVTFDEWSKR